MYKKIAITNRKLVEGDFLDQIKCICEKGVDMIVLRETDLDEEEYVSLAQKVQKICSYYQVELRWHLFAKRAYEQGEQAIHLPFRNILEDSWHSSFKMISTSVHSIEEARQAKKIGVTELFVSNIFETSCKPGVMGKGLKLISTVKNETGLPVYALGGIKESNERSCIEAGADGICKMSIFMK